MKLIVGLGNPGREYENTRHNVGFMVLDAYAKKKGVSFSKEKFQGLYTDFYQNGEKIILLKPQTYMNLSGESVFQFVQFFSISLSDILIINDDLDLAIGTFKLKASGSSGGHNGLKNIEQHLNTNQYKRFKIGISNDKMMDTKDYVLGRFSTTEKEQLDKVISLSLNILDDFLTYRFDVLMNQYNKKQTR